MENIFFITMAMALQELVLLTDQLFSQLNPFSLISKKIDPWNVLLLDVD